MSENEDINPADVNWDYDAPTNVLDFGQDEHEMDNEADRYFDIDHEELKTPLEAHPGDESFPMPSEPAIEEDDTPFENDLSIQSQNESITKTENAISMSLTKNVEKEANNATSIFIEETKVGTKKHSDKSAENVVDKEHSVKQQNVFSILPNIITPSRMANWKRPNPVPLPRPRTRSQAKPRTRSCASSGAIKSIHPKNYSQPPLQKKRKLKHISTHLTQTKTPEVLRRKRTTTATVNHKSRIEKELEDIKLACEKAKKVKDESSKSFKKAIQGDPVCSKVSVIAPTATKEFHFHTDSRIKNHNMATRQNKLPSEIDFTKELRKHPPSPVKLKRTIVQPFHLSTNRKRKIVSESNVDRVEFVPMAKAVMDFQTQGSYKTRFSKLNINATAGGLTVAKTPKLQARKRSRPVTAISMKEMEENEVESIKQYSFHAQPLNTKILKKPAPLPLVEKKESTKPVGFHFATEERQVLNRDKPVEEKHTSDFKAQPVPISSLVNGCVSGVPIVERKQTCQVKSFSFAERDEKMLAKKEEKIKDIIQKEKEVASSFRAQPILDLSPHLPPVEKKIPTQQVPFQFKVDQRGQKKAEEWSKNIENEKQQMKKKAEFKANSDYTKVLYGKAFVPHKENKVIEVEEFALNAAHRKNVWDENRKKRENHQATVSNLLKENQQQAKEQEEKEIQMMRQNATHKAHSIRRYKPMVKVETTVALTKPCSPKFSKRFAK